VKVTPRWGPDEWAYAVGRYARGRAPGEWNPGACGVAAAGDDWEARLVAIWGLLKKTELPNADFEIAPWFVSGGRVMFALTAHVAIAPRQQRAEGGQAPQGRQGFTREPISPPGDGSRSNARARAR
jgi:hypothetical protein